MTMTNSIVFSCNLCGTQACRPNSYTPPGWTEAKMTVSSPPWMGGRSCETFTEHWCPVCSAQRVKRWVQYNLDKR